MMPWLQSCRVIGACLVLALCCSDAFGQVTSRFVAPGGAATSTKAVPGGTFQMELRVDAPATATIGAAFRLTQFAPGVPPVAFRIVGRDFTGSIYDDVSSGTPDAVALALPGALLDPANDDNLGRNSVGLAGVAPGSNLFVERLTLSVDPATALGTYTIRPTAGGTSAVTDAAFNDYDMSASATFDVVVGRTLAVVNAGAGAGVVTSSIGSISCPSVCADIYPGSTVVLTATPNALSSFVGWSGGGCSGTGTCTVTVNADTTVTATYALLPQTLTVTTNGTGTGSVTSAPAGIACPGTCAFAFPGASTVTLTPVPNAGSAFTGWSGACTGLGGCVVTMSIARAVTATFGLPPVTTITGHPSDPSSVASPPFTFTSSLPGSTFQCSLDGGPVYACSSPTSVNVSDGLHTFFVQAIGPGNNVDPVGASYTWTVRGVLPIPALGGWTLALLALAIGAAGMVLVRRRRGATLGALLGLALALAMPDPAQAQSSPNFRMRVSTQNDAGPAMTSPGFDLNSSLGESLFWSPLTSPGFRLLPGIWYAAGGATPVLTNAYSRKVHGAAGTFDLPLTLVAPPGVNHNPTTEPRRGPTHVVVFRFDKAPYAADVAVTEGTAVASAPVFNGLEVVVALSGVSDGQYVTVTLGNVVSVDGGSGGFGAARIGFLMGDVDQSRAVSAADLASVNGALAQPASLSNYLTDVNASGAVTLADKGLANSNMNRALPTP